MIRRPAPGEPRLLAALWHDAWHETHAHLVPSALTAARTPREFWMRTHIHLPEMRVTGPEGAPTGLCIVQGDELDQLYVAPDARGTGAARALMADAMARLAAGGTRRAWLLAAQGNDRAARFYEKEGWEMVKRGMDEVKLHGGGTFRIKTLRFERDL